MSDTDTWFLLVQHKRAGRTDVTSFEDATQAAAAYSEAERTYEDKLHNPAGDVDVLLVGASSIEVVKERYASYFTSARSRADKLHKLLAGLPSVPAH